VLGKILHRREEEHGKNLRRQRNRKWVYRRGFVVRRLEYIERLGCQVTEIMWKHLRKV
jgi:hypothetical protein